MLEIRTKADGSRARTGTITTAHNRIETPVFMPVGTRGSVRTQTLAQLERLGASIILSNTYHLLVRPGIEVFERLGGLHRWMGWKQSILTDSGGFQIFSLPHARSMGEDGAEFRSYADGTKLLLTPERSIAMQRAIGSDIMMVLDQCIDSTSSREEAQRAMELTHRWARRSLAARAGSEQALFAIVQGACFEDLRRASAEALTSMQGFDGFAIGGLAVGESRAQREDMTELTAQLLPEAMPRYLMGVGTPLDLLEGVHRGIDMFDCILPTAWAQQGVVFTSHGRIDLKRSVHKLAEQPLDRSCDCEACALYSRSYLHHLIKAREPLGWQLLAFHNLRFYLELMTEIRAQIDRGTFAAFHAKQRQILALTDQDNPPAKRPTPKPVRPTTRGQFRVHQSSLGFSSIQHLPSGEVMHAANHPDVEAERVYVEQSIAIEQALAPSGRPLVVWDVGLGAAHNAMALIRKLDSSPHHAPISIVSFERDLDAFQLALSLQRSFPHLRHAAPHILANAGNFRREGLEWRVCQGDFLTTFVTAPQPDVIFYDPFSSHVDAEMWSLETFRRLFAHLAGSVELFTYRSSTALRSSLLAAGFHVAHGVASHPKPETTIALKLAGGVDFSRHAFLGREWLDKRARSSARFSADVAPEHHQQLEQMIRSHAQFCS
ncbi:MAG: queuine tRNA-ribosyltransferase [Myxococcales bacterium]|nr:queuine tRNA-ribosyltransferase [Myxococcales bacterium]